MQALNRNSSDEVLYKYSVALCYTILTNSSLKSDYDFPKYKHWSDLVILHLLILIISRVCLMFTDWSFSIWLNGKVSRSAGDTRFQTGAESAHSARSRNRHGDLERTLRDLLPAKRDVDDVKAWLRGLVDVFERR